MKKIYVLLLFAGMFGISHSQDVNVSINNQDANTKEDCAYRINGICSSEDIGGVDVEIVFADNCTWILFTNYNSFPVTTLCEITPTSTLEHGCNCGWEGSICFYTPEKTISIVLGVDGSKKIKLDQNKSCYGDFIDNSSSYNIVGIISRRLSK